MGYGYRSDEFVIDLTTEEGVRRAVDAGLVRFRDLDPRPIGNTPHQNHHDDPLIVDPREIRSLDDRQRQAFIRYADAEFYAAMAGFETWRGKDRWYYTDVIGVAPTAEEADKIGMGVGPITREWLRDLRMVGDQLAMRMLNPYGKSR